MAKKPSGLGRGLDELLEDNAPSKRQSTTQLAHQKSEPKQTAPQKEPAKNPLYPAKNTSLYNTAQPKLKSILKSN